MKTIGFTGTRQDLTIIQIAVLRDLLLKTDFEYARHGCCVGADERFHWIIRELERKGEKPAVIIIGHRSNLPKQTSVSVALKCDSQLNPKAPLLRNRDIVDHSDVLIACPGEQSEVLRSGTWMTIRYAGKRNKPTIIIYPNGEIERRNSEERVQS